MLKIVQAPQTVLTTPANKIPQIDKAVHKLIAEMKETLDHASDPEGVGLAAPQVGKSLQLFIIKPTARSKIQVFINPVLTFPTQPSRKKKKTENIKLEGCLSLYNIWGVVNRFEVVHLSYQDETGAQHNRVFKGFLAIIIQHEFDHLQGILFPRRVFEQNSKLYKALKNEKGETEFEEIAL